MLRKIILFAVTVLICAAGASAAPITVAERDIALGAAGDLDILNTGVFVAAESYNQDAPLTINGVTFTPSNFDEIPPGQNPSSQVIAAYSAEMNDLLGHYIFGTGGNNFDILMSLPTVAGKKYRLQLLQYQSPARSMDWVFEGTLTHNWVIDDGEILQVDFTAADSTFSVLMDYDGANLHVISGYALHEIPEPASVLLMSLGGVAMLRRRRA